MNSVVILGAGRIGLALAHMFNASGSYKIIVADSDSTALQASKKILHCQTEQLDIVDRDSLTQLLSQGQAVVSALPFHLSKTVAQCALGVGCSYFDLTEDVESTEFIASLADQAQADQIFMPQCGLAPGFISILAMDVFKKFDHVEELKLRVGALPEFPSNRLMYNLTWSTAGLINEYCRDCKAIRHGKISRVLPLEGLEHFSLHGVEYEAFNTSGGLGSLCETLHNKVDELTYKTIRYPGHHKLMSFLLEDLKLNKKIDVLSDIIEQSVAVTDQDRVLIVVSATGNKQGRFVQETQVCEVSCDPMSEPTNHKVPVNQSFSAIQRATASSIATSIDLFFQGQLPKSGFVQQEQISLKSFLDNPFSQPYRQGMKS